MHFFLLPSLISFTPPLLSFFLASLPSFLSLFLPPSLPHFHLNSVPNSRGSEGSVVVIYVRMAARWCHNRGYIQGTEPTSRYVKDNRSEFSHRQRKVAVWKEGKFKGALRLWIGEGDISTIFAYVDSVLV